MARSANVLRVILFGDKKNLQRTFAEAERDSQAFGGRVDSIFSGINRGVGRSLDDLGGRIVGWAGTGIKAVTGLSAAFLGSAIFKGGQRLIAIDEAQAQLRGLGHDTDAVAQIMDNALEAVKGTAFGMGEAATIAATAVAAGVQPGKDLARYLTLVGDAATIGRVALDEMGDVMNKVTASGRVQMYNINQFQQRGIPVLTWLGEEYGKSADAMRDMVSRGEVDAETFMRVLEENIGGAAQQSGQTFMGAFRNMGAAVGRFGAALMGPGFEAVKGYFAQATELVDQLTERVGPWAEQVSAWLEGAFAEAQAYVTSTVVPAFREFSKVFTEQVVPAVRTAIDWVQENQDTIMRLLSAVGPAAAAVAGLAVSVNLAGRAMRALTAATPIGMLLTVASALVYAYQNSESFRAAVDAVVGTILGALPSFDQVKSALGGVGEVFRDVQEWISGLVDQFRGAFGGGGDVVEASRGMVGQLQPIWDNVTGIFSSAWDLIKAIVDAGVRIVTAFWERFGDTIMSFAQSTWDNIVTVIEGATRVIRGIIEFFTGVLTGDWSRAWGGIQQIVSGAWAAIRGVVSQAINLVRTVIRLGITAVAQVWSSTWTTIRNVASRIWNAITSTISEKINAAKTTITTVVDAIKSAWSSSWDAIRTTVRTVMDAVSGKIADVTEGMKEAFRSARDAIGRAVDGIRGKLATPINWVINTAYNNGIRKFWNMIASKIGLPELGELRPIELNRGGRVLHGSAADRDSVLAALTRDEWVINRRASSRQGDRAMAALNAGRAVVVGHDGAVLSRQVPAGLTRLEQLLGGDPWSPGLARFNQGGKVEAGQAWARSQAGKPYIWGGVGPRGYDCSGFMSAITNFLLGQPIHRRRFATASFAPGRGAGGLQPGLKSAFGVGVVRGSPGHMAGTLGGLNVESRGSRGVVVGSAARGARHPMFNMHFHLPQVGGEFIGGSGDGGPDSGIVNALRGIWDFVRGLGEATGDFATVGLGIVKTIGKAILGNLLERVPFGGMIRRMIGFDQGAVFDRPWSGFASFGETAAARPEHVHPEGRLRRVFREEAEELRSDRDPLMRQLLAELRALRHAVERGDAAPREVRLLEGASLEVRDDGDIDLLVRQMTWAAERVGGPTG